MTADHQAHRGSGWEAMHRTLAADAVVAEAPLDASGGRRLTVKHGQPLANRAGALVQQLVDDVNQAPRPPATSAAAPPPAAGRRSPGPSRPPTSPSTDVPARQLVLAARLVADRLNPGS